VKLILKIIKRLKPCEPLNISEKKIALTFRSGRISQNIICQGFSPLKVINRLYQYDFLKTNKPRSPSNRKKPAVFE
jgi:hypothetical protein